MPEAKQSWQTFYSLNWLCVVALHLLVIWQKGGSPWVGNQLLFCSQHSAVLRDLQRPKLLQGTQYTWPLGYVMPVVPAADLLCSAKDKLPLVACGYTCHTTHESLYMSFKNSPLDISKANNHQCKPFSTPIQLAILMAIQLNFFSNLKILSNPSDNTTKSIIEAHL